MNIDRQFVEMLLSESNICTESKAITVENLIDYTRLIIEECLYSIDRANDEQSVTEMVWREACQAEIIDRFTER